METPSPSEKPLRLPNYTNLLFRFSSSCVPL